MAKDIYNDFELILSADHAIKTDYVSEVMAYNEAREKPWCSVVENDDGEVWAHGFDTFKAMIQWHEEVTLIEHAEATGIYFFKDNQPIGIRKDIMYTLV